MFGVTQIICINCVLGWAATNYIYKSGIYIATQIIYNIYIYIKYKYTCKIYIKVILFNFYITITGEFDRFVFIKQMLLGTKKSFSNDPSALFMRLIVQRSPLEFFVDHLVCKKQESSMHTTNVISHIPQLSFYFGKENGKPFICSRYTRFC